MPGVRPRSLIDNLLHVRTAERADLCFAGARAGPTRLRAGLTAVRTQVFPKTPKPRDLDII
jgi:hypothetical protein